MHVLHLRVAKGFRSEEGHLSKERIGTRLMLRAMEKARELGKKILNLEYDPGGYGLSYSDRSRANGKRRSGFFKHFRKFNVLSSKKKMVYGSEDNDCENIVFRTYYIHNFQYKEALTILVQSLNPKSELKPKSELESKENPIELLDDTFNGYGKTIDKCGTIHEGEIEECNVKKRKKIDKDGTV